MHVYTHYYSIKNSNKGFRWRTLLQFGTSWNIIGSVVMKNPGSANFKNLVHKAIDDKDILNHLHTFDNNSADDWYEFTADATIYCVGDLFTSYYNLSHREDLNGVIQIFNLFYVKDANLGRALSKDILSDSFRFSNEDDMSTYDIEHLIPPIYLGFGGLAWHPKYKSRARRFFNAAAGMRYLKDEYEKNSFRHPLYLMKFGKNENECQETISNFKREMKID